MPLRGRAEPHQGYRHPFHNGTVYVGGIGDIPRTLTDLAMSQFSAELRRKYEWFNKYKRKEVRKQWISDACMRVWKIPIPSGDAEVRLSKRQIEYVIDELSGYDLLRDETNRCFVSCFERIWESDCLLEDKEHAQLSSEIASFRSSRESPSTSSTRDGSTLLVDPYLYPLVYRKSLARSNNGTLSPAEVSPVNHFHLRTYAFLSSRVAVSSSSLASFTSYINNIDPDRHPGLYSSLSRLLSSFIPLFEYTLTDLHRNNPLSQRITGTCRYYEWEEPDEPEFSDDEVGWVAYEREMRAWSLNRPIQLPDVPSKGYSGGLETRRCHVTLRDRDIFVVVQIEHIQLTSDNPEYPESSWSVLGMLNERIVACGLYCASTENVSQPSVKFRMAVTYPRGFMAGDTGATLRTWGLRDGDPCHQYIGSVPLRQGAGVVFPNIYQHQYSHIQLTDPTRGGHLTLISFLLVDPDVSGGPVPESDEAMLSTANVAPQQKDWIERAVDDAIDKRLPIEVVERIMEYIEGPMSWEEATHIRRLMISERDRNAALVDQCYFSLLFDAWSGPGLFN